MKVFLILIALILVTIINHKYLGNYAHLIISLLMLGIVFSKENEIENFDTNKLPIEKYDLKPAEKLGKVGIAPWKECPGFFPEAHWLWSSKSTFMSVPGAGNKWNDNPPQGSQEIFYYLYNNITDSDITDVTINAIADNYGKIYQNGKEIPNSFIAAGWGSSGQTVDNITVKKGYNVFKFIVQNAGDIPNPAGFLAHTYYEKDGKNETLFHTGMDGWFYGKDGWNGFEYWNSETPPPPVTTDPTTASGSGTLQVSKMISPAEEGNEFTQPPPPVTTDPTTASGSGTLQVSKMISPAEEGNGFIEYDPNVSQSENINEFIQPPTLTNGLETENVTPSPLYYAPGTVKYGGLGYKPSYEDINYMNNKFITKPEVVNNLNKKGICDLENNIMENMDEKCSELPTDVCAATSCCILLDNNKCVHGNEQGPKNKGIYNDTSIKNKDSYYYMGKCYGNCSNVPQSNFGPTPISVDQSRIEKISNIPMAEIRVAPMSEKLT